MIGDSRQPLLTLVAHVVLLVGGTGCLIPLVFSGQTLLSAGVAAITATLAVGLVARLVLPQGLRKRQRDVFRIDPSALVFVSWAMSERANLKRSAVTRSHKGWNIVVVNSDGVRLLSRSGAQDALENSADLSIEVALETDRIGFIGLTLSRGRDSLTLFPAEYRLVEYGQARPVAQKLIAQRMSSVLHISA